MFGDAGMILLRAAKAGRRPRFSGETEDRALVENLMRVDVGREIDGEPTVRQDPGVPGVSSPRDGAREAQEGRIREAGSRTEGEEL
jgi:hypothetical protein